MSVGLDIGTKTIKAVELVKEGEAGFRLKAAGVVGYQGERLDQLQGDAKIAEIGSVIKKLLKDTKISSRAVSISLPESQVFTRPIRFPPLTDQEIASAVKWEAEQYIPIPVKEAIIQHIILEKGQSAQAGVLVLLVATPKALVERFLSVVNAAGLNCVGVETELLSAVRSLAPKGQTVLILNLGAKATDLAIAKNTQLVFTRSISTGGDAFSRAVTQSLGVTSQQAEEYKRTYGFSSLQLEGKVMKALSPVLNILVDEIRKAIHFYQTEEKGESPSTLILTGGGAGVPEIASALTKLVGIEVTIGNPFDKVKVDPQTAKNLAGYGPLYSVAVGLAMRGD